MPLRTLVARITAVVAASGLAAATVIALEPAGPAAAGGVTPQAATVTTGTPLSITGTVTSSGGPVNGDVVSLLDGSGNTTTTATTQSNGTYTVMAPQAGTAYYEQFSGANVAGVNYQTQYLGGSPVFSGSQALVLAAGQSITGADATLVRWNTPQPTVTSPPVTLTQTVTTGTPGITINQAPPTATVTETVTTPPRTVTVTKTVTKTSTKTTTTSAGSTTAPSVVSGSLGGIGAQRVALKFKVDAGADTGGLKSFEVKLPKGFTFVSKKLKTGLKLGRLKFTYKLSGGALTVTLKSSQKTFSASFGGGAIRTTAVIAKHAKHQKIASVRVSLRVRDAKGTLTAAPFVIAKPS